MKLKIKTSKIGTKFGRAELFIYSTMLVKVENSGKSGKNHQNTEIPWTRVSNFLSKALISITGFPFIISVIVVKAFTVMQF